MNRNCAKITVEFFAVKYEKFFFVFWQYGKRFLRVTAKRQRLDCAVIFHDDL
jgi:hypothetical protein